MNDKTNYIAIKAMTMLITKSESIKNYMLLKGANEGIEEYKGQKGSIEKNLWIDHNAMKNDLLKGTTEEEIYKYACDEYAEITSLLFN